MKQTREKSTSTSAQAHRDQDRNHDQRKEQEREQEQHKHKHMPVPRPIGKERKKQTNLWKDEERMKKETFLLSSTEIPELYLY